jgi:hypothetical protein
VHVRREGSAQREAIGARLLLPDSPRRFPAVLGRDHVCVQRRPLNACLHLDRPALPVEREDALQRPRVEQQAARAELLAAHGVAATADGDRKPPLSRARDRATDLSSESTGTTSATTVSFSCEWMSLTTTSANALVIGVLTPRPRRQNPPARPRRAAAASRGCSRPRARRRPEAPARRTDGPAPGSRAR